MFQVCPILDSNCELEVYRDVSYLEVVGAGACKSSRGSTRALSALRELKGEKHGHVFIRHKVKDGAWRRVFDGFASKRRVGGEIAFKIANSGEPTNLCLFFEWQSVARPRSSPIPRVGPGDGASRGGREAGDLYRGRACDRQAIASHGAMLCFFLSMEERTMAEQDLIRLACENVEAYNVGNWQRLKAVLAPDVVYHEVGSQRASRGRRVDRGDQGWKQFAPNGMGTITKALTAVTRWHWRLPGRERIRAPSWGQAAPYLPLAIRGHCRALS